jgi:hypothetical protein
MGVLATALGKWTESGAGGTRPAGASGPLSEFILCLDDVQRCPLNGKLAGWRVAILRCTCHRYD